MDRSLERKLSKLRSQIRKLDSALVAFSGGVDSSFLVRICREELGDKAVAVTALSDNYPSSELVLARRVAKIIGAKHLIVDTSKPEVRAPDLCRGANVYSCLKSLAMRIKVKNVLDGSHHDDMVASGDSFNAARKAGVESPLLECDLTKAEIRLLAKELGLPNWDKPPSSKKRIVKLVEAQRYLRNLKAKASLIVRGEKAVIVAGKSAMADLSSRFETIERKLKSFGFSDVVLKLG